MVDARKLCLHVGACSEQEAPAMNDGVGTAAATACVGARGGEERRTVGHPPVVSDLLTGERTKMRRSSQQLARPPGRAAAGTIVRPARSEQAGSSGGRRSASPNRGGERLAKRAEMASRDGEPREQAPRRRLTGGGSNPSRGSGEPSPSRAAAGLFMHGGCSQGGLPSLRAAAPVEARLGAEREAKVELDGLCWPARDEEEVSAQQLRLQ